MIQTKTLLFGLLMTLSASSPCLAEGERISIAGTWQLATDSAQYRYTISLPGSTDEAGVGKEHVAGTPLYIGRPETWQLARKRVHIGPAWYTREVEVPASWKGKQMTLSLERCMWTTALWVDGTLVGEANSLCAPHTYDLTGYLTPGTHTLLLRIDNSPYVNLGSWSHGYAPGIQTIWNGAIGDLYLEAKDEVAMSDVQCYTAWQERTLRVTGRLDNLTGKHRNGTLLLTLRDAEGRAVLRHKERIAAAAGTSDFDLQLTSDEALQPWDEYSPYLYTLTVDYRFGKSRGTELVRIGFRDLSTADGKLLLNGRTLYLRGEHDPGSFPLTGYPSMDKADWLRIFRIGKEYGLNHWRFHSWCPPEAAFAAADEVGIYLQPELELFSQNWEHTRVGEDSLRDAFLTDELKRLLDTYGNHPSFLLMCMGNELKGDASVLERWVAYGKHYDPRHLYASNANLEAMGKFLPLEGDEFQVAHAARVNGRRYERRMGSYYNHERPATTNDYSHTMQSPYDQWPIISHELGQWGVYPDFSEIERYTGVLAPRNLEIFRSLLQQKGMADMAPRFVDASGRLAALLYKEEMERALRTPGMDGFQILDLRDYPAQGSAYVGLLNAFWDSKGVITPEEFRQSCNDVTLLLKMPKRTWLTGETFSAQLVVPNYGQHTLSGTLIRWQVLRGGNVLLADSLTTGTLPQGEVTPCGTLSFALGSLVSHAAQLEIQLSAPALGISNRYNVWAYPDTLPAAPADILIAQEATPELLAQLEAGATVLLVPKHQPDAERITFATPFWSTLMFDYQPKSMGLVCNPEHPLFAHFPTASHTDWQWWELTAHAYAARINDTPLTYRPILQVIDHPVRNDKLGAIMETRVGQGRLLVCMLDILSSPDSRPVARQLKHSILQYMASPQFAPAEVPGLKECFFSTLRVERPCQSVRLDGENPEHPATNLTDGRSHTRCALPVDSARATLLITLKGERYITGCTLPVMPEGISSFDIYITDDPAQPGDAIISGAGREGTYEARSWDNGFTVQKGKKGRYVILEVRKQAGQAAALHELELIFGD